MKSFTSRLWKISIILTAFVFSIPILTILSSFIEPSGENWEHLKDSVLTEYIYNSLLLTSGVGVGALVLGVSTAWLTTMCKFPGKKLFVWLVMEVLC